MKQLHLRIPAGLHRRLIARAAWEGRSLSSLASEILAAADVDREDRRTQLRAAADAVGTLRAVDARPVAAARRQRILDSTKGLGPQLHRLLSDET